MHKDHSIPANFYHTVVELSDFLYPALNTISPQFQILSVKAEW